MTLSLLIYSIAQRRMRNELKRLETTLPNQIGKPVQNPTLRWIFQQMEGIDCVNISHKEGEVQCLINGLNDIRRKILTLFGQTVSEIYQIATSASIFISGCCTCLKKIKNFKGSMKSKRLNAAMNKQYLQDVVFG